MKKLFTILVLFSCFIAGAQVYTPQTAAGYGYKRIRVDTTLHIPSFCGVPVLRDTTLKHAAIAFDSCNHRFYFYDPKTLAWDTIKGGGTGQIIIAGTDLNTDSIPEGSFNLYFTTDRVRESLYADSPVLYDANLGRIYLDTVSATGVATKHDLEHIDTAVVSVTAYMSGDSTVILVEKNGGATNKIYLLPIPETDPTVSDYVKSITAAFFAHGETAYSWGNHALAGYLTSYTETDPIWTAASGNYRTFTQNNLLYAGISHTHDAGDIISGILPIVRGGTGIGTIGTTGQSIRVATGGIALEYYTPAAGNSGTVTTVTGTAPISITGTPTATPNVTITQATTSTNGYLSSTDWNIFNNKQAAGNFFARSGDSASYVWFPNQTIATTAPANGIKEFDSSGRLHVINSLGKVYSISASLLAANQRVIDSLPPYAGIFLMRQDTGIFSSVYQNGLKVNVSDTAAMVSPYLKTIIAAATYATIANMNLKLNISDTANKWVRTILKNATGDSIIYFIGGTRYAVRDSIGSNSGGVISGSIVWPGTIYSTPTTGAVSAGNITFSPSLASQSAYTLFGRGSGSGVPSFLASIDSNWIPSLHSESYYNTKYLGIGGAATLTGAAGDLVSFSATNAQSNIPAVAAGQVLYSQGTGTKPIWTGAPSLNTSLTVSTIYGNNTSGSTLTLLSTSHATKGKINMGTSAYDEVNNRFGINTTSPLERLQVTSDAATLRGMFSCFSATSTDYTTLYLLKGRGTNVGPTAISSGDVIGSLRFVGQNGSGVGNYNTTSMIEGVAAGNFTSTSSPSNMVFYTTPSASVTMAERMRIDLNGNVGIGVTPNAAALLDVSSTTKGAAPFPRMTTSQRNAIASPFAGLTIYCSDCTATDASTGVTQTYNGSVWKNYW